MTNPFRKAVKHEAKLRLAIAGPSGAGKTYTSLAVATALASAGSVAVIDTEHGSAAKYASEFRFDVLDMRPPYHPDRFVEAIRAASAAGYGVLIIDSLSHAWNGEGGLLDVVEEISRRMKTSNSFAAWKDATPTQNRMIAAIVGAPMHIICTMRSKQEYVLEQFERNGRTVTTPRKVGMAPVQRDSTEYEFDIFLDMDIGNNAIVQKTRCPALTGRVLPKPGADLAGILRDWLSGEPEEGKLPVVADVIDADVVTSLDELIAEASEPGRDLRAWWRSRKDVIAKLSAPEQTELQQLCAAISSSPEK